MKNYLTIHPWKIIEDKFHPEHNEITESLMSIGNGRMGQRGMLEESFSGHSLQGSYIAGVWFPDKTRVGWWKNGYPDYFAKVINSTNWSGIEVAIDGEIVDLAKNKVIEFYRELDMQSGILSRNTVVELSQGKQIRIESERFCSLVYDEGACMRYKVTFLNFKGKLSLKPYLDGDVSNKDSNHGDKFWEGISQGFAQGSATLSMRTKKSPWTTVPQFTIASSMILQISKNGQSIQNDWKESSKEKYLMYEGEFQLSENESIEVFKYVANLSSENHSESEIADEAKKYAQKLAETSFLRIKDEQVQAWSAKWETNDIQIEGDDVAQQGIRFNIFHLQQTYTGQDARLNIGPKGFTGEKYGGVTYWDTEAYCIPFYLSTAPEIVSKNLLVYRHNHLAKAIENAQKLGFSKGAALYPMVTMNGEECHNEWEITFEEIHRNGAIAYAIFDYVNYTGDSAYLNSHGLEVLIGISRFWAQRVNWSENLQKYVMLGVTGPNEYENNVNNNWYTNYLAVWTLKYTIEALQTVKENSSDYEKITRKVSFDEASETKQWQSIIENMYFPYDTSRKVFLQQDGFLDKELKPTSEISEHRPIN
ncbi:MAG: glycoside hydrolase family 65 protein, partial [Leadbetterella sp.]